MTPNQIQLIRETWQDVVPIADTAAQLFYQRLFEIDPSTKSLFEKTDMARQGAKLINALNLVVENIEQFDTLKPHLEELGRRHERYGVEDHHYESVGAALIMTLEQGLGPAFTAEAGTAWASAYALVSNPMRCVSSEASGK
ncbi:MAG: globin family protein [Methyloligellaceae bacterium]